MDDREFATNLGLTVRRLRLSRKISQEQFATLCGLHRTYIGAIERGEKNITVVTACKISSALKLSLPRFFEEFEQDLNK